MDSFTQLVSPKLSFGSVKTSPSNTIALSTFGRVGERHITGTITRKEAQDTRWLVEGPQRFVLAFALLLAPSLYNGLTEGASGESVMIAAVLFVLLVGLIFSVSRYLEQRRISAAEVFADATHISTGLLTGSGALCARRRTSQLDVYATNQGVIAILGKRGQRTEYDVHRLDVTATPGGRVTGTLLMINGEHYAMRAVRGSILRSAS